MERGSTLSGVAQRRRTIFGLMMLGSFGLAFAASPFGCGLDDSALEQMGAADGSFSDTGLLVGEGGQPIGDGGADVVTCAPETCNNYPSICRTGLDNGCGGKIDCLTCPGIQKCIPDSGTCDGPPICRDAGQPGGNCETIVNSGNGLEAGCGECSGNYMCATNTCTCPGTVCGAGGATCCQNGTALPNCNATAGTCCKLKNPATDCAGSCSNAVDNGCGGTMDCSNSCGSPMQCNPSNHTCCSPDSTATTCGTKCNTSVNNNCNVATTCPASCSAANETCTGTTCSCPNTTCNGACCAAAQVCNAGACCTKVCSVYACTEGDNCGGNCGTSCPLPDYNFCYGAGNICTCDSNGGACSACAAGYKQCSAGTGGRYKSCIPSAATCPG